MDDAQTQSTEAVEIVTLDTGHVVTVRALTSAELDVARSAAGPFPIWGHKCDERFDRMRAALVERYTEQAAAMPDLVRPDADEIGIRAYAEAMAQMREHDPEAADAREQYGRWTLNSMARIAATGVVSVKGWEMPDDPAGVQALIEAEPGDIPIRFIGEVGGLVHRLTSVSEGKGPARPSPSTSAPVALAPPGASDATAATTP